MHDSPSSRSPGTTDAGLVYWSTHLEECFAHPTAHAKECLQTFPHADSDLPLEFQIILRFLWLDLHPDVAKVFFDAVEAEKWDEAWELLRARLLMLYQEKEKEQEQEQEDEIDWDDYTNSSEDHDESSCLPFISQEEMIQLYYCQHRTQTSLLHHGRSGTRKSPIYPLSGIASETPLPGAFNSGSCYCPSLFQGLQPESSSTGTQHAEWDMYINDLFPDEASEYPTLMKSEWVYVINTS